MRLTRHAACAAVLALSACAYVPPARVNSIRLVADADANLRHATALDVAFVYTADAMKRMPSTAAQWFETRDKLIADLPAALKVKHMKLAPGLSANVSFPRNGRTPLGVYSYANYIPDTTSTYCNLTSFDDVTIRLSIGSVACGPRRKSP